MERPLSGVELPIAETEEGEVNPSELIEDCPDALIDRVGLSSLDDSGEEIDVDLFFSKDHLQTGEKMLFFSVLEQAIQDFLKTASSFEANDQRKFHKLLKWFTSDDMSWECSFVPLCHVLEIDESNMRDKLNAWRLKNAPHSFESPPKRRRRPKECII